MNEPTIIDELKTQLKNKNLEIAHLNAVNQELYDELTEAKLKLQDLLHRECI